jgi:hypothetical protein
MGPFAYVAASLMSRTVETAVAMGFAVDDLFDFGGRELWESATKEIAHRELRDDKQLYRVYMAAVEAGGVVAALGRRQVESWSDIVGRVGDSEAARRRCGPSRSAGRGRRNARRNRRRPARPSRHR